MTRDEKIIEIKNKVELETIDEIKHSKQFLSQLMQGYNTACDEEAIDLVITEIFILNSLLCWIKSDSFCKELYPNRNFILRDHQLDIILDKSFNFTIKYLASLEINSKGVYNDAAIVGLTFTDKYIGCNVINVFDEILYDKEH